MTAGPAVNLMDWIQLQYICICLHFIKFWGAGFYQQLVPSFSPYYKILMLWGGLERGNILNFSTARVASVFVDRESEKCFLGRNMENSYHKDFFPPKVLGSKCNFTCSVICTCHWCSGLGIVGKRKTSVFAVTNNFETDEMHICLAFPLHLFKWRKGTRKRERINLKIPLSYEIYIIQ